MRRSSRARPAAAADRARVRASKRAPRPRSRSISSFASEMTPRTSSCSRRCRMPSAPRPRTRTSSPARWAAPVYTLSCTPPSRTCMCMHMHMHTHLRTHMRMHMHNPHRWAASRRAPLRTWATTATLWSCSRCSPRSAPQSARRTLRRVTSPRSSSPSEARRSAARRGWVARATLCLVRCSE